MARRTYTDEERREAIELLSDAGLTLAFIHEKTGVPKPTLCDWANRAGIVRSDALSQAKTAASTRIARIAEKRSMLQEDLLDYAADLAREAHKIGTEGIEREVSEGSLVKITSASDSRSLMVAAAIAIDKFRLEMGETTSVVENRGDVQRAKQSVEERLDQLASKRKQRAS